ncbi:hypothetical protein Poly51_37900 [Rubripirellula tenax]|uniref:Uncharacterized protein n=1 Tax=Rubripirellula tenax TaxID=2528015 RepID=A0A5C6EQC5_9BACT|nr:hypothetical protein Poly51_37900 [Rubripirellula tenax]
MDPFHDYNGDRENDEQILRNPASEQMHALALQGGCGRVFRGTKIIPLQRRSRKLATKAERLQMPDV